MSDRFASRLHWLIMMWQSRKYSTDNLCRSKTKLLTHGATLRDVNAVSGKYKDCRLLSHTVKLSTPEWQYINIQSIITILVIMVIILLDHFIRVVLIFQVVVSPDISRRGVGTFPRRSLVTCKHWLHSSLSCWWLRAVTNGKLLNPLNMPNTSIHHHQNVNKYTVNHKKVAEHLWS